MDVDGSLIAADQIRLHRLRAPVGEDRIESKRAGLSKPRERQRTGLESARRTRRSFMRELR
jgi:hypothetical protein